MSSRSGSSRAHNSISSSISMSYWASLFFSCLILSSLAVIAAEDAQEGSEEASGKLLIQADAIRSGFSYTAPAAVKREDAFAALIGLEQIRQKMKDYGLSVSYIDDAILVAKRSFIGDSDQMIKQESETEQNSTRLAYLNSLIEVSGSTLQQDRLKQNYSFVLYLVNFASYRQDQAYKILDTLPVVDGKERQYRENGVNTTGAVAVIENIKKSFKDERYDEALALIGQANEQLDAAALETQRVSQLISFSKGFVARNWWQMILLLVLAVLFCPSIVRESRALSASRRIKGLKFEKEAIMGLLKNAQEEYLRKRTITKETYEIETEGYKRRLTEISHTIPVLESQVREVNDAPAANRAFWFLKR